VTEAPDDRQNIAFMHEIGNRTAERAALRVDASHGELHLGNARRGKCQAALDAVRVEQVVGVEKQHEFTARQFEPDIRGTALAAVGDAAGDDARAKLLDDVPRVVARTVVDDDDLDIARALAQRAVDRRADKAPVVLVRDDDRNAHCRSS
jgi:hypothetical protein